MTFHIHPLTRCLILLLATWRLQVAAGLEARMDVAYRRASHTMFITSITDAIAFYTNAISSVPIVRQVRSFHRLPPPSIAFHRLPPPSTTFHLRAHRPSVACCLLLLPPLLPF